MKHLASLLSALCISTSMSAQSVVYETRDISPEAIVKIYHAVGRKAEGRVAVKISTGESEKTGYLRPDMLKPLLDEVHGTIVECNTAYNGCRGTTENHLKTVRERGFTKIAPVDIMDSEDTMHLALTDRSHMQYNIVGSHLSYYDFMINLAHFKGHACGGFGGVLKNASIGCASRTGKVYIHTAGYTTDPDSLWQHMDNQDGFVESMAAAAQAVHNYFDGGQKILYINVMYRMSIDCDCDANPHEPLIEDYGILASTDPVALDQACYDIIKNIHNDAHNNNRPFIERVTKLNGTHVLDWGEKIGLGSTKYMIINIDCEDRYYKLD